jgi:hypothetical protein
MPSTAPIRVLAICSGIVESAWQFLPCEGPRVSQVFARGLQPAFAATPLWRGSFAWLAEPKLAEGERRMVDLTGIEPVTS